jgi:hypothetical protein
MATVLGVIFGLLIGVFGFLGMRNPMTFAYLSFSPGTKGYYQRRVLDPSHRNQLRFVGALVSFFGAEMFTSILGATVKSEFLKVASDGFLVVMGCLFAGGFCVGLILTAKQLIKGELFDWVRMWRAGHQLGPIDVFPPITPKMQRETTLFTIVFVALLWGVLIVAAIRSLL